MENKEIPPKIGDIIYVPTRLYMTHGLDDHIGGKDIVTIVRLEPYSGGRYIWVTTETAPKTGHNWEILSEQQEILKERFRDRWAYADPDDRPEFNY